MPYTVEYLQGNWWAVSADRRCRGPFPTRQLAEEHAEELTALDAKLPRRSREEPRAGVPVLLLTAAAGVGATGGALGLVGAVAYWTFRLVTGV